MNAREGGRDRREPGREGKGCGKATGGGVCGCGNETSGGGRERERECGNETGLEDDGDMLGAVARSLHPAPRTRHPAPLPGKRRASREKTAQSPDALPRHTHQAAPRRAITCSNTTLYGCGVCSSTHCFYVLPDSADPDTSIRPACHLDLGPTPMPARSRQAFLTTCTPSTPPPRPGPCSPLWTTLAVRLLERDTASQGLVTVSTCTGASASWTQYHLVRLGARRAWEVGVGVSLEGRVWCVEAG
jgi:hypothetical protein